MKRRASSIARTKTDKSMGRKEAASFQTPSVSRYRRGERVTLRLCCRQHNRSNVAKSVMWRPKWVSADTSTKRDDHRGGVPRDGDYRQGKDGDDELFGE